MTQPRDLVDVESVAEPDAVVASQAAIGDGDDSVPWNQRDVAELKRAMAGAFTRTKRERIRNLWHAWARADDRALMVKLEALHSVRPEVLEAWVLPYYVGSARKRARQRGDLEFVAVLNRLGQALWPDNPDFQPQVPRVRPRTRNAPADPGEQDVAREVTRLRRSLETNPTNLAAWTSLIVMRGRQHGPAAAEEELGSMQRAGIAPNVVTFTAVINGYARKGALADAERIFAQVKQAGVAPNERTFNAMIEACVQAGELERAERTYEEMLAAGLRPDAGTHGRMINAYARAHRFEDAERELAAIEALVETPEPRTYATMLRGYATAGRFAEAETVIVRMQRRGVAPIGAVFVGLIDGYAQAGRMVDAEHARARMEAAGVFEESAYGALVHGYAQHGAFDQAEQVIAEMEQRGVPRNERTYGGLIDAFLRAQRFADVERILHKMASAGKRPNAVMYHMLVHGYAVAGRFSEAERVRDLMVLSGIKPTEALYGSLIKGYAHAERLVEAERMLAAMEQAGYAPNARACVPLLFAYAKLGRLSDLDRVVSILERASKRPPTSAEAHGATSGAQGGGRAPSATELLVRMEAVEVQPAKMYVSLVTAYAKSDMLDDAERVFHLLRTDPTLRSSAHEIAYGALIHGHVKAGRLDDTQRLLELMARDGLKPDHVIYDSILRGYVKAERFAEVESVLARALDSGVQCDAQLCAGLVQGFVRHKRFDNAERVLGVLREKVVSVDPSTYGVLVRGYLDADRLDDAERVIERLRAQGVVADRALFNDLVEGIANSGALSHARAVIKRMKEKGPAPDHYTYGKLLNGCANSARGAISAAALDELLDEGLATTSDPRNRRVLYNTAAKAFKMHGFAQADVDRIEARMLREGVPGDRYTLGTVSAMRVREGLHRDERLLAISRSAERWKEVGVVTGDIVHELSQIVTALGMNLSTAMNHLNRGAIAEAMPALVIALEAKKDLSDRLLEYHALTGSAAAAETFDVREVIVAAADRVRATAGLIAFHVGAAPADIYEKPLLAHGARVLLQIAIKGLLDNALHALSGWFSEEPPYIAVTVAPFPRDESGDRSGKRWIDIRIRDNGPGVPPDLRSKIFTDGFTTKSERGLGIGLSLAHNVAETFGGTLQLADSRGPGAEFWIRILAAPAN